jgi:hypothetical protein
MQGMDMPEEFLKINEQSLMKLYKMIDLESAIEDKEKLFKSLPQKYPSKHESGFDIFQRELSPESQQLNEDKIRSSSPGKIKSRENRKTSTIVKSLAIDQSTIISIIRDDGRIEITVKGKQ